MGKKLKILTEEEMLKSKNRFTTLLEYSFVNKEADLLLDEDDDDPVDNNENQPTEDPTQQQGVDQNMSDLNQPETAPPVTNQPEINQQPNQEVPIIEPQGEDEVEIDVTDLTDSQKSIEDKVDFMTKQTENFLNKIEKLTNDLQSKIQNVDGEVNKIKGEIIKRLPTNKEVLQKRITISDPFNQTPESYWNKKQQEGGYELSDDDQQNEYEIKASDIDVNPTEIYKSLGISDNEWNQSLNTMFR